MALRFGPRVRLRSHREFQAVQQQGARVAMRYLTMLARPNTLGCDRLGVIASRRLGGAVLRNRAKRMLREMFRHLDPDSAMSRHGQSLDLVVIPRPDFLSAPADAIQADFGTALSRLRRRQKSA